MKLSLHCIIVTFALLLAAMVLCAGAALAQRGTYGSESSAMESEVPGGMMEAEADGVRYEFPLLSTEVHVAIAGDVADVTVVQVFENPAQVPVHARYLFPLNRDAAVHAMTMQVGREVVEAVIMESQEAQETFEQARDEGRAASLLTQHRPNMFTQDLANLMPGMPVTVTLKYVHPLPRKDNEYELVVPLIVGPRYQPLGAGEPPTNGAVPSEAGNPDHGPWELEQLPEYPEVAGLTVDPSLETERVSVDVVLAPGMEITSLSSPSHDIEREDLDDGGIQVHLAQGRVVDNKDFVLRFGLAGSLVQAGLLAHRDESGGYMSLLIEPPDMPAQEDVTPRELVFVLDTSGSMNGAPMDACKVFMRQALDTLRPGDWFRIVRFANESSEFSRGAVRATNANVAAARAFVDSLWANGGTEMRAGITRALDPEPVEGAMRLVIFLTDGYIGNEYEIMNLVRERIGEARLFALGVGNSVNRFLLEEMASLGRGRMRCMDPGEAWDTAARDFALSLEAPLLTDIHVDWDGIAEYDVQPDPIPDLFAGESLRITGRFWDSGPRVVTITGRVNGRDAEVKVPVVFPDSHTGEATRGVVLMWARERMARLARDYYMFSPGSGGEREDLREEVVRLGLKHSLASDWTSFVAVSRQVVNEHPETTRDTDVPLPMAEGVEDSAYPQTGGTIIHNHAGGAAPEPATVAGLAVLALCALWTLYRRRARHY